MTRLLLVEDSPFDAELLMATLRTEGPENLQVDRVKRLGEALQQLSETSYDCVVLDLTLPDAQGSQVFHAVQTHSPSVPIVILTGLADAELALETVRKGAQDYLVKDEVLDRALIRAITHAIERKRLHLEAQRLRQEALEMERRKTEFLATVSHELRNPMSGIVGFVELLGKTALTPLQAEYVGAVQNSSRSMLGLLNGLLDLSSAEAGHVNLQLEPLSLRDTLEELAAFIVPQARSKGLEVVAGVDPALPDLVLADSLRLRQVVLNLMGNALKFTSSGYIGVFARVRSHTADTVVVRFVVEDSGRGIPADKKDSIFGAFRQTRSEDRAVGAGLGLSISKRLIGAMGGVLGVESEVGFGTALWFDLPFQIQATSTLYERLRGVRVLLGEDHRPTTEAVTFAVERMAGSVRVAQSAEELIALQQTGEFDLVISRWPLAGAVVPLYERSDEVGEGFAAVARPLRLSELYAAQPAAPAAIVAPREAVARASVLVVDDDPLCRQLAEAILHEAGARCVLAGSGEEAMEAAAAATFDLVLLDNQLPDVSGAVLAQKVRRHQRCPVVAVTGSVLEDASVFDGVVLKPVAAEQLQVWLETEEGDPVDWTVLNRFRKFQKGTNSNLIADLIETFRMSCPRRVKLLFEAVESKRADDVVRVAHQLRGAAGSVGATRVAELCAELESDPADTLLAFRLQRELARALRTFAAYVEQDNAESA
jgi:signal transduction histidine kinase/HPt (histidine-containing phosphotransfer) domain-containing protein